MPCGKITNGKHYSIITDHLGTSIEAYNQEGELIWEREQDLYGNFRQGFAKENFRCPFKYQGQYYDPEIELCYNRFRYYHPETGRYISEDPIKLLGGFNVFAYVEDTNAWVDLLGLSKKAKNKLKPNNDAIGDHSTFERDNNGNIYKYETYEMVKNDKGQTFFNPVKRFDGGKGDETPGAAHRNKDGVPIPTPHINHKNGEVRKPTEEEFPNNERFRKKNSYDK